MPIKDSILASSPAADEPLPYAPYSPDALYALALARSRLGHGASPDPRPEAIPDDALWRSVFEGSWPDECFASEAAVRQLHENIVLRFTTDAATLARAGSLERFRAFLRALAAESGLVLRYGRLAQAAGVTAETIKRWVQAAEEAGLIYLLQPWPGETGLQLMRSPKILWIDTGIIAAFLGLESPEAMAAHPAAERFLETFASTLVMKSWADGGRDDARRAFYYMKDSRGFCVDLVIDSPEGVNGLIVEKTGQTLRKILRTFKTLAKLPLGRPLGACAVAGLEAPLRIVQAKSPEQPGVVLHGFERLGG